MANIDDKTAGAEDSEVVILPEDAEASLAAGSQESEDVSALHDQIARLTRERDEAFNHANAASRAKAEGDTLIAGETQARLAAQEGAIDTQIYSATSALKMAKEAYSKALEAGEYVRAADLAEEVANARSTLNAANWQKGNFAAAKEHAKASAEVRAAPIPAVVSREEQLISSVSTESAAWLRQHSAVASKMVNDDRFMARVTAADSEAYAELGERDTPRYFQFIEEKLGLSEGRQSTRQTNGTTTAATPRRSNGMGATQAGRTTTLDEVVRKVRQNSNMVAAAKTSFPNDSEEDALKAYAKGIVISKQRDPSYLPEFKL